MVEVIVGSFDPSVSFVRSILPFCPIVVFSVRVCVCVCFFFNSQLVSDVLCVFIKSETYMYRRAMLWGGAGRNKKRPGANERKKKRAQQEAEGGGARAFEALRGVEERARGGEKDAGRQGCEGASKMKTSLNGATSILQQ